VTKRLAIACAGVIAAVAGGMAWRQAHAPRRPQFVLINKTDQHDFDLVFRMSLKLAENKSGIENALVLLPSLPPSKTIEQLATDLFTQLRIGARRNGRGILYLYAARENLMKIEVSYALEGDIPDALCHRLEKAAQTYMLSDVPQDFISELIITTNLRGMGSTLDAGATSRPEWLSSEFLSGGGGALAHGYRRTLEDYQRAIRRLPDAALGDFSPSPDAAESVRRYLHSLAAGIGDPRLPLLTEGSRIFRAVVPRNGEQQQRIHEFFFSAGAYQLIFEDDTNFFIKYADNPFVADLRALKLPNMAGAMYGNHARAPTPSAYPFSIDAAVRAGEEEIRAEPDVAANYAKLGDLYLFEMNWLAPSIELHEKASALAPDELAYRWRLMDLYLNASRADKMLAELKYLAEHLPGDTQTQDWYRAYRKDYDFGDE
jgi:hypothetical protein